MFGIGKKKEADHPLLKSSKQELVQMLVQLQNQNQALHAELTIQHERAAAGARVIGDLYTFMFSVLHGYVSTLQIYREQYEGKQVPALWLAARMCEQFEVLFNTRPLEHYDLGPDRLLLKNLFDVARRQIPEGRVKSYLLLGVTEDAIIEQNKNADET